MWLQSCLSSTSNEDYGKNQWFAILVPYWGYWLYLLSECNSYCKTQHYCALIVTVVFPHENHIAHNYPYWTSTIILLLSHSVQGDPSASLSHCLSFLLPYILQSWELTSSSFFSLFMDMWNIKGFYRPPLITFYHHRIAYLVLPSCFPIFQAAIQKRTLPSCPRDSFDSVQAFSTGPLLNIFWKSKHSIYTWI